MAICALLFAESIRLAPLLLQRSGSSDDFSSLSRELINFVVALLLLQVFSHSAQLLLFPLWSLSAEWITNIVAVFFVRILGKWQVIICILIGCILVGLGLVAEGAEDPSGWVINLGRCFLCFGAGQLIHKTMRFNVRSKNSNFHPILAFLSVFAYYLILNLVGTSALILAPLPFGYLIWVYGKGHRGFGTGRMKSISILAGQYSYGVYVWHIPALGVCDILLSKFGIVISRQFLVNIIQVAGTLFLSVFFTYIVLKYVEKAPFAAHGLNSPSQEIK
jgi:peptidoglycan/LPS O-acetylase OafA/YrhL